jgi:hypothetical protein
MEIKNLAEQEQKEDLSFAEIKRYFFYV